MKQHQKLVVEELRNEGYAVAIFYPCEIGNASSSELEDVMVREGNESLEILNAGA